MIDAPSCQSWASVVTIGVRVGGNAADARPLGGTSLQRMRYVRLFLYLIGLLVVIGDCSEIQTPFSTSLGIFADRMKSKPSPQITFPTDTPELKCAPPCFFNIIPGTTTYTETQQLLHTDATTDLDGSLWWTVKAPRRDWYAPGQMISNDIWFRNGIVESIVLQEEEDISLKAIVEQYGAPNAIALGYPEGTNLVDFILIYSERGIAFTGRRISNTDTFEDLVASSIPRADTLVECYAYFEPIASSGLTRKLVEGWRASGLIDGVYVWHGFDKPIR